MKDCPIGYWKKVMEEEAKSSILKIGVNVVMVDWDQLILDVCVTIRAQTACMLQDGEPQKREINPSRGQ
jgi:hypothetical protein